MKTNFTKENFLVLKNSESKIVAIIQCKKGKQDIKEKLIQAIGEDYDSKNVEILTNKDELNDYDYELDFNAAIKCDDYEDIENFSLTFAHVY